MFLNAHPVSMSNDIFFRLGKYLQDNKRISAIQKGENVTNLLYRQQKVFAPSSGSNCLWVSNESQQLDVHAGIWLTELHRNFFR